MAESDTAVGNEGWGKANGFCVFNCGVKGGAKGFAAKNGGGAEKLGIGLPDPCTNGNSTKGGNTKGTYASPFALLSTSSSLSLASKVHTLFSPNLTFFVLLLPTGADFFDLGDPFPSSPFFDNELFCGMELGVPGAGG